MQNKKSYGGTKLLIALALTVLIFVPISSQAFIVDFEGNNATGIRNLELDSILYNVVFRFDSADNIYGDPPNFDFNGEEPIIAATTAVNAALNSVDSVWTVGPRNSSLYNIGAAEERLVNDFVTVAFASAYNDRTALDWDVAKDVVGLVGVNLIPPFEPDTYADFTVVPIPAAVWLFGGGLIGLLGLRRRFKN